MCAVQLCCLADNITVLRAMPTGKRDLQFEQVISDVTADLKLTRDGDFTRRVVQLRELLAIRHCVFLMGPTGSGRSEVYKVRGKPDTITAAAADGRTQHANSKPLQSIHGFQGCGVCTHRFWLKPSQGAATPQLMTT